MPPSGWASCREWLRQADADPLSNRTTLLQDGRTLSCTGPLSELRETRLEKGKALAELGQGPYALRYEPSHRTAELQQAHADLANGEERDVAVAVAGRVMTRRVMGKLAFFTLADETGPIQLFIEKATLAAAMPGDPEAFAHITSLVDAGDLIGVQGTLRRTDRGELSVKVKQWQMLSKSLQPLPDKWHGLADVEKRYRQRYLDLIVSPHTRETFRRRAVAVSAMRRWLDERDFLEIETPVLQSVPGGADARPFETHHNALDLPLTLRIATELHLKRLVVGGFERVYELGRIFRNEGVSTRHNPEFTSVEIYQAYADYTDMMELTEQLIAHVCQQVCGTTQISYQGSEIDLAPPWRRATMHELVEQACCRLTAPGIGSEGGTGFDLYRLLFQGLFLAPQMITEALLCAELTAAVFDGLGLAVNPLVGGVRSDVIQAVRLGDPERLKTVCRAFQAASPVGAYLDPVPAPMPGYASALVMAGGTLAKKRKGQQKSEKQNVAGGLNALTLKPKLVGISE